jgi:hypothetical protein
MQTTKKNSVQIRQISTAPSRPVHEIFTVERRAGPGTGCGANISSFSISRGKARPRCSQVTVFTKMRRFYWFSRRVIASGVLLNCDPRNRSL